MDASGVPYTVRFGASTPTEDWQVISVNMGAPPAGHSIERIEVWCSSNWTTYYNEYWRYNLDAVEILDLEPSNSACEIVSVSFDKEVYQSGIDLVNIEVTAINHGANPADMTLACNLYERGSWRSDHTSDQFALNPNTYDVVSFVWDVPPIDYSTEYKAKFSLAAHYPPSETYVDVMSVDRILCDCIITPRNYAISR